MPEMLLDRAGRRRSPATMPGFHAGRPPRNKGLRYPADPPKVEEIVAVMRTAGDDAHGRRLRGLIVVLWRAGLRIQGSAGPRRSRSRSPPRCAASASRQGRTPPRGRHGQVGLGRAPAMARTTRRASRRPTVLCAQRPNAPAASGRPPPPAPSCGAPPSGQVSADGSPHISSGTPTPSKWLAKVCRSWSSSASSGTATSASPRSSSRGSTTPRSSTSFTAAAHR
jgi:hypothetical protein